MTAAGEEARPPRIAAVVIGRNEGERLRRCLDSMVGSVDPIVYVDSGSTDGSVAMARGKGVDVVALDLSRPFTAARARNEGFRRVLATHPETDYVQFVDGDCEVQPGWLALGRDFLGQHPEVAAVCGWRQERKPQESVYNLLCDIEWKVPPGPAKACGGDVMMRAAALDGVGGYRDDLIAGEEPELCVRLRAKGWGVHVLGVAMTLHDAAMTRFSQWWMRNVRAGFALAEGAHLHGAPPERHCVRELRRALVWGLGLPLVVLCATLVVGAGGLGLLAIYPLQVARLYVKAEGDHRRRLARATFLTLAKFPEVQGALRYWRLKTLRRSGGLIEYK
ncbi:MAG: glycosyltransferase [Rhizobacter sp.]|nr:glycosyltransferase [Rhizobacter sp.]